MPHHFSHRNSVSLPVSE